MRTAFGDGYVPVIVYREKDMSCVCEIWEGLAEFEGVGCLHQHEGHGGAKENNVGGGVFFEVFVLEVSIVRGCSVLALVQVRFFSCLKRWYVLFPKGYCLRGFVSRRLGGREHRRKVYIICEPITLQRIDILLCYYRHESDFRSYIPLPKPLSRVNLHLQS